MSKKLKKIILEVYDELLRDDPNIPDKQVYKRWHRGRDEKNLAAEHGHEALAAAAEYMTVIKKIADTSQYSSMARANRLGSSYFVGKLTQPLRLEDERILKKGYFVIEGNPAFENRAIAGSFPQMEEAVSWLIGKLEHDAESYPSVMVHTSSEFGGSPSKMGTYPTFPSLSEGGDPSGAQIITADEEGIHDAAEDAGIETDGWELMDQGEILFRNNGIRIGRDEELYQVAVMDDSVVAATVTGESVDADGMPKIRFSVVVDPRARRMGLARQMVANIVEDFPEHRIEAWVVNPEAMVPLLSDLGFEGYSSPSDPMMTLREEEEGQGEEAEPSVYDTLAAKKAQSQAIGKLADELDGRDEEEPRRNNLPMSFYEEVEEPTLEELFGPPPLNRRGDRPGYSFEDLLSSVMKDVDLGGG